LGLREYPLGEVLLHNSVVHCGVLMGFPLSRGLLRDTVLLGGGRLGEGHLGNTLLGEGHLRNRMYAAGFDQALTEQRSGKGIDVLRGGPNDFNAAVETK
jgi:hypothetical protein